MTQRCERTAMSKRLDKFCNGVRDRLHSLERRVKALTAKVESNGEVSKATIDTAVREARATREVRRADAEAARINMKERLRAQREETEDRIAQWKLNREIDRLQRRADDAEDYAAWSILVAVDAIDEADLAVMEAIAGRLDADIVAN
jgi:hypothetical protein